MTSLQQTPVTVLTGYLGAGKTTLLNRILSKDHERKYAVIVNEFGEVGIDNDLVVEVDEEVFEMNNGCICCTVRDELVKILEGLVRRRNRFDGILVETTGRAYPATIAQTFLAGADVRAATRLDAIVTVVDARHLLGEIEVAHEAQAQLAFANTIIVNKTDLVAELALEAVEARIRRINPTAKIHRAERCAVDLDLILDQGAFDLDRILEFEPNFPYEVDDHKHSEHVTSVPLITTDPLDPGKFLPWIRTIVQQFGLDLLRLKGILSMKDDDDRFVVQAVHRLIEGDYQRPWKAGEERMSRLVLIGRNLPRDIIEAGFLKCRA